MISILTLLAALLNVQAGLTAPTSLSRFPGLSNFLENYVAEQQRRSESMKFTKKLRANLSSILYWTIFWLLINEKFVSPYIKSKLESKIIPN